MVNKKHSSESVKICPGCKSARLITYVNDTVCGDCGLVANSGIAEQISKKRREKSIRPIASQEFSTNERFATVIERGKWIGDDEVVFGQDDNIVEKWQKLFKVSDATERNLALALLEVTKIGNRLSIPEATLETASSIYMKAAVKRITKRRSIRALSAAAIYLACRHGAVPRSLDEIASASNLKAKEIGQSYRFLVKKLDMVVKPIEIIQYLKKLSIQLKMQRKAEEIASKILKVVDELRLSVGRDPIGMVAAASYIAMVLTGERKTQREIAEVSRITEATIRNRYKEITGRLSFVMTM